MKTSKRPEYYQMSLIVRKDIKMKPGKVAAQCSHAAVDLYKGALKKKSDELEKWELYGSKKVTLKIKDLKEMTKIEERAKEMGLVTTMICDAGKTEVVPGTFTVLGIFGPEKKLKQVSGHLKTL